MKQIKLLLYTTIVLFTIFCSCKKDKEEEPLLPVSAASLNVGKCGLRLTTNKVFKGSQSFDESNTDLTTSLNQNLANGIRNLRMEAVDRKNNQPNRKVTIDIMITATASPTSGSLNIDLSVPFFTASALPRALVRLEGLSVLGSTFNSIWDSNSGLLTITKLTSSEIEGTFSAVMNDGMNATGSFAGKF